MVSSQLHPQAILSCPESWAIGYCSQDLPWLDGRTPWFVMTTQDSTLWQVRRWQDPCSEKVSIDVQMVKSSSILAASYMARMYQKLTSKIRMPLLADGRGTKPHDLRTIKTVPSNLFRAAEVGFRTTRLTGTPWWIWENCLIPIVPVNIESELFMYHDGIMLYNCITDVCSW